MYWAEVGVAALLVGVLAAVGVAGIATGWVPRPGRHRVLRPRLWGYGSLTGAAGMAAFMFLGPLARQPSAHPQIAAVGMGVYFLGLYLQVLARRPGRALYPDLTKNAS